MECEMTDTDTGADKTWQAVPVWGSQPGGILPTPIQRQAHAHAHCTHTPGGGTYPLPPGTAAATAAIRVPCWPSVLDAAFQRATTSKATATPVQRCDWPLWVNMASHAGELWLHEGRWLGGLKPGGRWTHASSPVTPGGMSRDSWQATGRILLAGHAP